MQRRTSQELLGLVWVHVAVLRPAGATGLLLLPRRDDVTHKGEKIDWGAWAITGDDPEFRGTGNPDTGDDYGPAPGAMRAWAVEHPMCKPSYVCMRPDEHACMRQLSRGTTSILCCTCSW